MNEKASVGLRLVAALIDHLLLWTLYLLLLLLLISAGDVTQLLNRLALILILIIFVFSMGIPFCSIFLTAKIGGTVGKLITGIEVIDFQGKHVSFTRAFFRNYIGYIVSSIFFWLGFIWIAVDRDRRGWHDMIADTFVVVKKHGGQVIGILAIILILGINLLLVVTTIQQFRAHRSLYQELVSEIVNDVQKATPEVSTSSPFPFATSPPLL